MFRYFIVFYAFFSAIFFTSRLAAIEVKDLYSAKVPVVSQIKKDRKQALQNAMSAVILKVAGQQGFLSEKKIKEALKNVESYVLTFRYQLTRNQNSLYVTFDENKINQLMAQADLPLWGRLRPQIILWIVEETGLQRRILSELSSNDSLHNLPKTIRDFSQLRGLPILMPIMDLTDLESISLADIWGRFYLPVQQASQRYMADAIVMVRLSNASLLAQSVEQTDCQLLCQQEQYALDWSFIADASNGDVQTSEPQMFSQLYHGSVPEELLQQALSDITDEIYKRYALMTNSNNSYIIDVANIDSLQADIEVEKFLAQLSAVKSVQLLSANGYNRRFKLSLLGSQQTLLASLKLNKQLQRYVDDHLAEIIKDAVPTFYWKP